MTSLNTEGYILSLGLSSRELASYDLSALFVDVLPSVAAVDTVLIWTSNYQLYRYTNDGTWVKIFPLTRLSGDISTLTADNTAVGVPNWSVRTIAVDNIYQGFDAYYNGTDVVSNRIGGVYDFRKTGGVFAIRYGVGASVGATVSMADAVSISSTGVVTIGNLAIGTLSVSSLAVSGNATVGGTLGVTGNQTNSGNIVLAGVVQAAAGLETTGDHATVSNDTQPFIRVSRPSGGALTAAIASTTGAYSNNSAIGDSIIRTETANNLFVQTGTGAEALKVDPSNNVAIRNNATVGGTLGAGASSLASIAVAGAATVGTTLAVAGASTLAAVTAAAGSFTTLASSGLATLTGLAVTGAATVGTTLTVTGASTLAAVTAAAGSFTTLASSGLATLNSLAVTNNATVGGTLGVLGATTLAAVTAAAGSFTTLASSGLATLNSLTVTGATTLAAVTAAAGSFTTLASSGLATLTSLAVTGAATVGTTLTVTGASTLAAVTAAAGSFTTLASSGLATLNSLAVTNNATVGGTLGVTGLVTVTAAGSSSTSNALGTARVGDFNANSGFLLTSAACYNGTDYGFRQESTGKTMVNAKTGQDVSVRVNNSAVLTVNSSGASSSGTLSSGGAATLNSLAVTNAATVGTTLGVTGNTTLTGTLTVSSTSSASISTSGGINSALQVAANGGALVARAYVSGNTIAPILQLQDVINFPTGLGRSSYVLQQAQAGVYTGVSIGDMVLYSNVANAIHLGISASSVPLVSIAQTSPSVTANVATATFGSANTAGNTRVVLGSNGRLDFSYGPFASTSFPAAASARIQCADNNYSGDLTILARAAGSDNATMNTNVTIAGATGNFNIARGTFTTNGSNSLGGTGSTTQVFGDFYANTLYGVSASTVRVEANGTSAFDNVRLGKTYKTGSDAAPNGSSIVTGMPRNSPTASGGYNYWYATPYNDTAGATDDYAGFIMISVVCNGTPYKAGSLLASVVKRNGSNLNVGTVHTNNQGMTTFDCAADNSLGYWTVRVRADPDVDYCSWSWMLGG